MADDVEIIAEAVKRGDDKGATLRIGKVTEVEANTGRVRLDITGLVWLQTDAESSFEVGERAYAFMQGPTGIVGGKLASGSTSMPVGALTPYAGTSTALPIGWAICNGQAVSRTAYPLLFARLGTTYGVGDNSTTFNLPNLESRFPVGVGGAQGYGRGNTGGSSAVTLGTNEIPAHTHGNAGSHQHPSAGDHTHSVSGGGGTQTSQSGTGATSAEEVGSTTGGGGTHQHASAGDHGHASVGGGASHENRPPYIAVYYIIRLT